MSRLEQGFLVAGIGGLVLCATGAWLDAKAMLSAWLPAALFALSLPLGALTILMVHGLTGGRWGEAVRQPLRVITATLPIALILLVPVLIRLDLVFPWAGADSAMLSEKVRENLVFLNEPFFLLRFAEEMSLPEIADVMGLRMGSVKTHLFRAVSSVRDKLKEQRWR